MSRAISVRLDDEALDALRQLEERGLTRSEAIREALVARARTLDHDRMRQEAEALAADPEDRAEKTAILRLMEELSGSG